MTGEFHRMSGRRLQEWEFHHTDHWLEYIGGAVVFVRHDQWDEVQFVSSGPVSLCEMLSASPALVLVHCYPRSSGFHFLNRFSKKRVETAPVAVVFSAFLFNSIHEAFSFRMWSSRSVRIHEAFEFTERCPRGQRKNRWREENGGSSSSYRSGCVFLPSQ